MNELRDALVKDIPPLEYKTIPKKSIAVPVLSFMVVLLMLLNIFTITVLYDHKDYMHMLADHIGENTSAIMKLEKNDE